MIKRFRNAHNFIYEDVYNNPPKHLIQSAKDYKTTSYIKLFEQYDPNELKIIDRRWI